MVVVQQKKNGLFGSFLNYPTSVYPTVNSEGVESTMSDVTYLAYSNVYYAPKEVMDNHFASQTRVESLATATYETHHHHHDDDHSLCLDDVRS